MTKHDFIIDLPELPEPTGRVEIPKSKINFPIDVFPVDISIHGLDAYTEYQMKEYAIAAIKKQHHRSLLGYVAVCRTKEDTNVVPNGYIVHKSKIVNSKRDGDLIIEQWLTQGFTTDLFEYETLPVYIDD